MLSRVGAFVEGPGAAAAPERSRQPAAELGRVRASGGEAQLDTALEIAGLGSSVDRRVKTYSQGMRQTAGHRPGHAGLPELLILDEPTNGLDPPQIAEMRLVLRSTPRPGRTVVVSSHLLAEVEQTCTHVVVMHRGRLVAQGSVADVVAGTDGQQLAVDDPEAAVAVLAAAGIAAETVPARRALEDVFLDLIGSD